MEDYVRPFRRRKIFDLRREEEECEKIISIQIISEREEYPVRRRKVLAYERNEGYNIKHCHIS